MRESVVVVVGVLSFVSCITILFDILIPRLCYSLGVRFFYFFLLLVFSIIQVGGSWSWVDADFVQKKSNAFFFLYCLSVSVLSYFPGRFLIISCPTTCIFYHLW